jgi:outer membrane protein TolC
MTAPDGRTGSFPGGGGAFLAALLLLSSAPLLAADSPPELTLAELLARVESGSSASRRLEIDRQAAREATRQAEARWWPTVDLEGGRVNLDNDPFFAFGTTVFPAGEQVSWRYKLSAQQILWDGGRRSNAVDAARLREGAIEAKGIDDVQKAQLEATEAWAAALSLAAQRGVLEQRRKAIDEQRRVATDLFEQGVVAHSDVLRTEVALRSVGDKISAVEDRLLLARQALGRAIGLDGELPWVLPTDVPAPPPLDWSLDEARHRAEAGNRGLAALRAKLTAEGKMVAFEKSDRYPKAVFQLFHSYEQNKFMLHEDVNGFLVGLQWNLFDGGARSARIREAALVVDRTAEEWSDARRAVAIWAEKGWREAAETRRESETASRNVEAATENLRILDDQYREGVGRIADVLDAEALLAESRLALVAKRYEAWLRQATMLGIAGENLAAWYGARERSPNAADAARVPPFLPGNDERRPPFPPSTDEGRDVTAVTAGQEKETK